LLAYLPDAVIASKLDGYEFEVYTERTITNASVFKADLSDARANGFAQNDREKYNQFHGNSAPIFNYLAEPIAVLNIWSVYPQHRLGDLLAWTPELLTSSHRVTELIGGLHADTSQQPAR
jgi:DNA-binding IclR family transcriptional regulator